MWKGGSCFCNIAMKVTKRRGYGVFHIKFFNFPLVIEISSQIFGAFWEILWLWGLNVTSHFRAKLRQHKEDVRVRGKMQKLCGKAARAFVILR